jgi:soluble lytic murein transglycosylase-like protein
MRGIGFTLSRLPAARAVFTGAAILAGMIISAAQAQMPGSGNGSGKGSLSGERPADVALAVPRVMLPAGNAAVALPQPLTPSDSAQIRRIFDLQAHGDFTAAGRATEAVHDPVLSGEILADRYLGRRDRADPQELAAWLARFPDLPDAAAIRALLLRLQPDVTLRLQPDVTVAPAAEEAALPLGVAAASVAEDSDAPLRDGGSNPALDRAIQVRMQRGEVAGALRLIAGTRDLAPRTAALLRGAIAQALFIQNDDNAALEVALASIQETPRDARPGFDAYIGGLAAWRLGRADIARTLFEQAAAASAASPRQRAAGALWAAQASRRFDDAAGATRWLRKAADEPLTFHGLVARRILDLQTGLGPDVGLVTDADVDAIAATPFGLRAFALLQVGQSARAAAEFRALWPSARNDPLLGRSLLLVVSACGLVDVASQLRAAMRGGNGHPDDTPRRALPSLRPAGGFRVDPALIYALVRIESNFDTDAVSASGARGLMQIMPSTANAILGDSTIAGNRLHDPAFNLDIGQRYVHRLARQDGIDGDLMRLLAGYNAGPGNVARWGTTMRDAGDPLLFIETIPSAQTRNFVPQVLTYSWLYAARLHAPARSLDAVAAGVFPRFTPLTQGSTLEALASQRPH